MNTGERERDKEDLRETHQRESANAMSELTDNDRAPKHTLIEKVTAMRTEYSTRLRNSVGSLRVSHDGVKIASSYAAIRLRSGYLEAILH